MYFFGIDRAIDFTTRVLLKDCLGSSFGIGRYGFQDLLGGDAEIDDGFVLPWLHPVGARLSDLGIRIVKPPWRNLISFSVDGKMSKSKQRWAIGVCDDIAGEGIFTGGVFAHCPNFVHKRHMSQQVVELLALIAGLEWACVKQKLSSNRHLVIVSDSTSWVANYKTRRFGRVRLFDAVGFEACLSKLMTYVTRACLHFEDVTIIHKCNSNHANFSPDQYVPDALAKFGFHSNVIIDPIGVVDNWHAFAPIIHEEVNSEGL